VVGVLTLLSMANSGVLASSRFPFAMARDKMLPGFLGSVNAKFMTPVYSIIVTAFVIGLAIIYLDVEKIAKLASAFKVLMFISVNLAVIVLRETNAQWYNPSYKSPFYPYVQVFGVISGIVLLAYLGLNAPCFLFLAPLCLWVCYFFILWKKNQPKGCVFKLWYFFFFVSKWSRRLLKNTRLM
jgi:APA family basic amino acid/polyamine antiporter